MPDHESLRELYAKHWKAKPNLQDEETSRLYRDSSTQTVDSFMSLAASEQLLIKDEPRSKLKYEKDRAKRMEELRRNQKALFPRSDQEIVQQWLDVARAQARNHKSAPVSILAKVKMSAPIHAKLDTNSMIQLRPASDDLGGEMDMEMLQVDVVDDDWVLVFKALSLSGGNTIV